MKIKELLTIVLAMVLTPAGAFSAPVTEAGFNLTVGKQTAEQQSQCSSLLPQNFRPAVYTSFAARSPTIRQSYATCYFDSVVGVVQDHILALQRKQSGATPLRELHIARTVPTAILLNHRTKEFLDTTYGAVNEQTALRLVDIGSPLEVINILKNVDFPLFAAGQREAYDGVLRTMATAQHLVSLALSHNFSESKVLAATQYYLHGVVDDEFNNPQNSDLVFRLDDIEILYGQMASSRLTPDLSGALKTLVDQDQYALVLLDTSAEANGHSRHVARLIGYRTDNAGKVSEVILQDTYSHNGRNGEWHLRIAEFETRYRGIIPLKVHGAFIPRSQTHIPIIK